MRINASVLEQLLAPAIEATRSAAEEHGLTDEQHADVAAAFLMRALRRIERDEPAFAARLHGALTS